MMNEMSDKRIRDSFKKLFKYCEEEQYKGFDPYDSLNSRLFNKIPILSNNSLVKLVWTQFFKRSPINLRHLVGIDKEFNPKAVGLFLSAFCKLYRIESKPEYLEKIIYFSDLLLGMQNRAWSGSCWGYNFDWQSRAFFQPKNTPTVVATTFIGSSLLDAYEITEDEKYLNTVRSSCDFILKDLNRTYDDRNIGFSFSYSPLDKSVVYNASLLGSRLLSRVYSFTHEQELLEEARKSVLFVCQNQQSNGAWSYGRYDFHQWIDNFHTGYNLECISDYSRYSQSDEFDEYLSKGFDYYIKTFFSDEGVPKYYSNSVYPIDIHAPTQLIITLHKLDKFEEFEEMAQRVLTWTIDNMQSPKDGYFYYQINRFFTSKIPYMRWSQAWMFLAFTIYLEEYSKNSK